MRVMRVAKHRYILEDEFTLSAGFSTLAKDSRHAWSLFGTNIG